MSGHMGNVRRTTQNLEVVRVDAGRNLLLVQGAVPGPKGSDVLIRSAIKSASEGGYMELQVQNASGQEKLSVNEGTSGRECNE
jgi:hypothetical protein